MNNDKLLKKLEEIKLNPDCLKSARIDSLIQEVKNEILLSNKKPSERQRLKYCLSSCEKAVLKSRPILAFTHYESGLQFFTNSAFAVCLEKEDQMNELPRHDEPYNFKKYCWTERDATSYQYPNVSGLFHEAGDKKIVDIQCLFNFAKINVKKPVMRLIVNSTNVYLRPNELYNALMWGNANEQKATMYFQGALKVIEFVKENGTKMIIAPLRYEGDETDVYFTI